MQSSKQPYTFLLAELPFWELMINQDFHLSSELSDGGVIWAFPVSHSVIAFTV